MESQPHLVVGIESAAFHFFEAAAAEQRHQPSQDQSLFTSHCVCLCRYAMSVSKPRLLTHLLVDSPAAATLPPSRASNAHAGPAQQQSLLQPAAVTVTRKLLRSTACFIGSVYDKHDGAELEGICAGVSAAFVSQVYVTALPDASTKSLATFFAAAGAQSGMYLQVLRACDWLLRGNVSSCNAAGYRWCSSSRAREAFRRQRAA
jgi:hypothetical protein